MDLNRNLLWALGSYDPALVHLSQLLNDSWAAPIRDDTWRLVTIYLDHRRNQFFGAGQNIEVPEDTLRQLRAVRRTTVTLWLVHYARLLATYGPHGDAPWRRVSRIVEQHYEEWRVLDVQPAS